MSPSRATILLVTAVGLAEGFATPDYSHAVGLLETHTLFTVYGRGFDTAPILGRLGTYKDFAAMDAGTRDLRSEIAEIDGGKPGQPVSN